MSLRHFRRQYEQFERGKIIGMMEAGWLARQIARQLGHSDCVVRRCWDQLIREMSFTRRPGLGRFRQNSRRELNTYSNCFIGRKPGTGSSFTGASVSSRTIQRRLAEGDLGSRCPLRVIAFNDESKFNLGSDGNRVHVWRPRGERLNPAFALQRHTAPTAGVMIWGAIAYNTRSTLVLIRDTMTAQWYVHDILQPHVLPLRQCLLRAIFQLENDRFRTERLSQDCLRKVRAQCSKKTTLRLPESLPEALAKFPFAFSSSRDIMGLVTFISYPTPRTTMELSSRVDSMQHNGAGFNSEQINYQVIYSQFGLAIHPNDHQARRRFVEWAQNEIAVVPDFHKRILFSDEAHFWFNGNVNKQNCRIWSEVNSQVYVETPLHPEKLTVWCALWAGGILGPYFLKNDEGHNVTKLWFQQDGATCHTARATIYLLKDTFGDRLISRFGSVNWPPRSCDLTPLDYFLWGYVNSLVYADKPQTLDHSKDNIRRVIADLRQQMLEKVIENWTSRLDYIRASRGSPMPEIIFKM
ncbi:DUF4817 domain-containing protein [Trichonephila clavipes]|nr:DUF4817 domain-containing protein [Trichonephila clavipes]